MTRPLRARKPLPTIRQRLVVWVNSVLLIFAVGFLYVDYRVTLADRLMEKQVALKEEAKSILPAIRHLHPHGTETVQQFIDDICHSMESQESPRHHIGVQIDRQILISHAHDSPLQIELPQIIRNAEQQAGWLRIDSAEIAYGIASTEATGAPSDRHPLAVVVYEDVQKVRRAVQKEIRRRLLGVVIIGLIGGVLVNWILWRLVNTPVRQLVQAVREIGKGAPVPHTKKPGTREFRFLADEIEAMERQLSRADRERRASLDRARIIQENLLPRDLDKITELNTSYVFHPAEAVGGDFFDLRNCGPGQWLICIADSAGHGVPAAMSSAMIKALLFEAEQSYLEPEVALEILNQQFMRVHPMGEFATVLLIHLDLQTRSLTYANAGHAPAWLFLPDGDKSGPVNLEATGFPLGIEESSRWNRRRFACPVGSRIVIGTDGITEAFSPEDEQFGKTRLLKVLLNCRNQSAEKTVRTVVDSVTDFRQGQKQLDDMTLAVIDT